jgi:hypothetical protein
LPIGGPNDTATQGNFECLQISWLGTLSSGVTVTITGPKVADGPFQGVDLSTAGCPDSPGCANLQISAADNGGGTSCWIAVEWTGTPAPDQSTQTGSVGITGTINCAGADSGACQSVGDDLQNSGNSAVPINFTPPQTATTPGAGSGSPDTSSS